MTQNVILHGALGRMGIEIAQLVLADNALKLHACVEYKGHPQVGKDYGELIGKGPLGIKVVDSISTVDVDKCVIIDFSFHQAVIPLLKEIEGKNCGIVVGTTGLGAEHIEMVKAVSKKNAIVQSYNTSLGVNLLFAITRIVASKLKDSFDIEVIEAHHRFKKDAPSGTARRLGEIIAEEIGLPYDECVKDGRSGISDTTRSLKEIGMHAVRGGDIVGDHTVLFAGMGERLELRHMMHSRNTLARGAVVIAKWLFGKEPGLYTMSDVLGL